MQQTVSKYMPIGRWLTALILITLMNGPVPTVYAVTNPQNGSIGLEGTISSPAPTRPATVTTPTDGRTFTSTPITVNGLCPEGTMVKVFSNNIFVGSVRCSNGSYSLQVDLFSGQNDLISRIFDDLDQAGPDSPTIRVIFNDAQFSAVGSRVGLTSSYARIGANPGSNLHWPIVISGGSGPYALTVDWGDGKPVTLKSQPFAGTVDLEHVYDAAGIYRVIVKVTDVNGSTAYLQLIGVANGEAAKTSTKTADSTASTVTVTKTKYSVLPAVVSIPLIAASFWIGGKYEVQRLRRKIEDSTSNEYTR